MSGPVRPSGYIGWASATGATNVAEPTDAQKGVGWSVGQSPPSSYENWLEQKRDRWIQYLSWKSELDKVVYDDFAYAGWNSYSSFVSTHFGSSLSAADQVRFQFYPEWFVYCPTIGLAQYGYSVVDTPNNADPPVGAAGMLDIFAEETFLGPAEILRRVGSVGPRDFKMEFVINDAARNGNDFGGFPFAQCSGACYEFGLMYGSSGMTLGCPELGFMWTGSTGNSVGFQYRPSGLGATVVQLAGYASGSTGFHKFTVENRSPTMAVYIDDQLQAAVPSAPVGMTGTLDFGARVGCRSGVSGFAEVYIDKVELSVRRGPSFPT